MSGSQESKEYALTTIQRVIWYDQLLHPNLPMCNIGGQARIEGPLVVALFEQALSQVIAANQALRTVLQAGENEPKQSFAAQLPFCLDMIDFSALEGGDQAAQAWMAECFGKWYDPYHGPLFYYALCRIAENHYVWLARYHHLIADGQTVSLVGQQVAAVYNAARSGTRLETEACAYKKFLEDDSHYQTTKSYEKCKIYWQQKFAKLPERLPLFRSVKRDHQTRSHLKTLNLTTQQFVELQEFARQNTVSTFHVLLASLYGWLIKTSNCDDMVFGLPIRNRRGRALKKAVGLFVGVMPAWFQLSRTLNFRELVQAIRSELVKTYRHQRFPINEISRAVGLFRKQRQSLFEVSFSYQKHDYDNHFAGVPMKARSLSNGYLQSELAIAFREYHEDEPVQLDFEFGCFTEQDIERLVGSYKYLLERMVADAETPLQQLPNMPSKERARLLEMSCGEQMEVPRDRFLHELFEEQAQKTPDALAFVYEEQQLSYGALERAANQMAHQLIALGVEPETLVALALSPSIRLPIVILGVHKAGGAYVPMNPDFPVERLQFMIRDTACQLLICEDCYANRFPENLFSLGQILVNRDWQMIAVQTSNKAHLRQPLRDDHPACVLYTSGSTGFPKGVVIPHGALHNKIVDHAKYIDVKAPNRQLISTTMGFDLFVEQFFSSLCHGGIAVLLASPEKLESGAFPRELARLQADVVGTVPSHMAHYINGLKVGDFPRKMKHLTLGGEAIAPSLLQSLRDLNACDAIFNVYGPTEAAIYATAYFVPADFQGEVVPIGKPMANYQTYLLDKYLEPVGVHSVGELYLAGAGLARSYLNRPSLTAERFLPNPLAAEAGARMYRTGDQARWTPDANLIFVGRLDDQVKINGVRIEPGEVEAALDEHPALKAAVVRVWKDPTSRNHRLIVYFQARKEAPSVNDLRSFLQRRLPSFMIPTRFQEVKQIPIGSNGKVDREALPDPEPERTGVPPETPLEHELAAIWRKVLVLEQVGIHDNFFDLGGGSLTVNQVHSQIIARWQCNITLLDLFHHSTIAMIADEIRKKTKVEESLPDKDRAAQEVSTTGGKGRGQTRRRAIAAAATRKKKN